MHIVQTMRHNSRHFEPSALDSVGIVGAGPGGLATGILLASHGVPTTIYEADSKPGGRCQTVQNQGFEPSNPLSVNIRIAAMLTV